MSSASGHPGDDRLGSFQYQEASLPCNLHYYRTLVAILPCFHLPRLFLLNCHRRGRSKLEYAKQQPCRDEQRERFAGAGGEDSDTSPPMQWHRIPNETSLFFKLEAVSSTLYLDYDQPRCARFLSRTHGRAADAVQLRYRVPVCSGGRLVSRSTSAFLSTGTQCNDSPDVQLNARACTV